MIKIFRTLILAFLLVAGWGHGMAQKPKRWSAVDIHEAIDKLNVLASALYVAAHPDDENTRLIALLANEAKAETAYLSLTRGDGGQNEIGPEIEELLGLIRTQELLAARRIDGGRQMFSRANDFGYSKTPEETLDIWGKEEILADVVWAIRKWQPDIIINRFDHGSGGRTHGHHTASAILAYEAFDLAADPKAFPEQLKHVELWQPRRLFFNTSWWFYGSQEAFEKADKSDMITVDAGVYFPMKGKSNSEIAAESRSMHKSQGFGSMGSRGVQPEYLKLLKGDLSPKPDDLFAGVNTTWTRVEGGAPIGKLLAEVEKEYNYENPSASVPKLIQAYKLIKALPDGYWKRIKLEEIQQIIAACMGIFAEAVAADKSGVPGGEITLKIECINRSKVPARWESLAVLPEGRDTALALDLAFNQPVFITKKVILPENTPLTTPYWLNEKWETGRYTVEDQLQRGLPETERAFRVRFSLLIDGEPLELEREVIYKYEDAVKGEVYYPFEVTPPVFINVAENAYIFGNGEPKTIEVRLKSGKKDIAGTLELSHAPGWRAEPQHIDFQLKFKGEETIARFQLFPPEQQTEDFILPLAHVGGKTYDRKLTVVEYDHIPVQTVLRDASAKAVRVDLKKEGEKVGYVMGLGDDIPASLRQIGYDVVLLQDADFTPQNLAQFDAVITGARAYNGWQRARFHQPALFEYVKNGGTLIVQYNKNFDLTLPMEDIAPYRMKISRDRVSVEDAEVRFLKPEHPALNFPNKITKKDFEGWIQERGLYFPNEWDERFEAVISCNDPGEPPRDGGLLIAKYGQGYYIYTGYSWFRQLPAGVPGAFRIFANLISIGKQTKQR
jgi:LmbE family N-acetylglucosaminyl deacetylase